jgi:hypothetical protein
MHQYKHTTSYSRKQSDRYTNTNTPPATVENRVTDTPIQTHHQLPPPLCRIYLTQELGLLQTLWKLHVLYHMYDITPGRNTDLEKSSPQNRILFLLDQFQ